MEKREKTLLGIMAATLVAAGAIFLSGPSGPAGRAPAAPQAASLDELARSVEQGGLSKEQSYRLSVMAQNASLDPFFGKASSITQDDPNAPAGQQLVYSGYMKVGNKLYAVINGIEYACGDQLAEGDYTLQAIDKNAVLLERTDGSSGRKYTKRVPLVEDDADKIRIRVVKKR